MSTPLITVAMPVFNAGEYLKPALLSIINQTYSNWELIIIDDGSTDGCFDNLPELNDPRIKVIRDGENKGIAIRLNQAIDLASGEFFARMDSDDISYTQRFELQLRHLQTHPELDLIAVRTLKINQQGNVIGKLPFHQSHDELCAKPWLGFYLPHPTWMGRLSWFKKYKYIIPQSYYSEDYELLLRSYKNCQFGCLSELLFEYRANNKIIWKNQFKARKAVLMLQIYYFYRQAEYLYLVFSLLFFVLKVIVDSYNFLMQFFHQRVVARI